MKTPLLKKLSQVLAVWVQAFLSLVLPLIQEASGHQRLILADCSRASGHPLHELIVHGGENVLPLHKLVVCGELKLLLLPDSTRCGRKEAELVSCAESIYMRKTQTELIIFTSMRLFSHSFLKCVPGFPVFDVSIPV